MVVLLAVSRRFQLAGGRVFWAYVAIYSTGRAWIDAIRTEPVLMIGPLRIHTVVALVMVIVAVATFALLTRRRRRRGGEAVAADGSFELSAQNAGPPPAPRPPTRTSPTPDRRTGPRAPARQAPGHVRTPSLPTCAAVGRTLKGPA